MNALMIIDIGAMRATFSKSFFCVGDGVSQGSAITMLCSQSLFIKQSMMIKICEFLLNTRNQFNLCYDRTP